MANVIPDGGEGAIAANDMVVAFRLPDSADVWHDFRNLFGAIAFDAVHDVAERPIVFLSFRQWLNQHMDVIGHHDEGKKVVPLSVEEQTSIQHNLPRCRRKFEPFPGVKGDEIGRAFISQWGSIR